MLLKDQLGREVGIETTPKRIISLVPSITELLYDLGLEEEVAGVTKFCIHPAKWFGSKEKVGGTKNVHIEKVRSLKPDIILASKEENIKEQIEEMFEVSPVWVSDINTLQDALDMILSVGKITGMAEKALELNRVIEDSFKQLEAETRQKESSCKVAYFIWQKPFMTVGGDTFINDMLKRCGWKNVFAEKKRYPVVTLEELKATDCNMLLLSSEPFPFKEKQRAEIQAQLPGIRVELVDGEMFSWYGSRLVQSVDYLKGLVRLF